MNVVDAVSYSGSFALPIGAVAVMSVAVGAWIVWHERARPVSVSLLAVTLAIGVYLGGFSLMVGAPDHDAALFWGKLAYLGVPFIVPAVYQFSVDLLGIRDRRRGIVRLNWAVGVIYAALAVGTGILVPDVLRMEWGYVTRITLWNLPILGWSAAVLLLTVHDYYRAYQDADAVQRARIRLFAIPIAIGTLGFIDYAPSFGLPVAPWGFLVFALFLLSAVRAVALYHLPDLTAAFAADKILTTMAEPLVVCDDRGRVAIANPAALRLLRRSRAEVEGVPLSELLDPRTAARVLDHPDDSPLELELSDAVGESIPVSVTTNPLIGTTGQRVGTVVVGRDIRERKRAALEIQRREQRFRALTESALDTISIIDGEGRITYESPSVRELLGYGENGIEGRTMLDLVHPESRPGMESLFSELVDRPGHRLSGEALLRHADGTYVVFEFRATNLLAHPAVRGIVVNGRDVTEERRLTAELQQAQKMEAIGRLAGGVAHDFNNILTAIQGNVAMIEEELSEATRFSGELAEIREGADRAARLTDQLLSFSRRQVIQPRLLDLNEVVAEMRSMLERLIGESIRLTASPGPDLGGVRADRVQVEQVLLNLLVNARDAVGGAGRVEIATRNVEVTPEEVRSADFHIAAGHYVVLSVTDDGHGMDPETQARIFEPFFTTKEAGRGTGLGLSTVYGSVRQAGGYIGVDSRPGDGTTFSVYLPRVGGAETSTEDEDGGERADAPAEERPQQGSGELVLVVEDERPVRSLMVRVLKRRGYEVLEAEDGEKALELAADAARPLDLLITDLVMPGLNGREVAERLRARHQVPVIFISGYTADEVVRQGIVAGQHEFLPKPFSPDALGSRVAAVLGRREAVAAG